MKTLIMTCLSLILFSACGSSNQQPKGKSMLNQVVTIRTNYGDIDVELDSEKAPASVANFLKYVDEKHYNGTIFHRVIDGFMIQGGGYSPEFQEKRTHAPVRNEADNRLSNKRGSIAMARTSEVHSATAQFFINVSDNEFLDFRNPTPSGFGYCVFGKVVNGMDIVDKIKGQKTTTKKGHQNVPEENVIITEIVKK